MVVEAARIEDLRQLATTGKLYAVIDACDTPAVPLKAAEIGRKRAVSLYRGTAEEMYWAIAPYLFAVDVQLLDWILSELWSEPWGIFAVADGDLEAVRRHFRRFLLVQSPEGEQWYFRFYDPRVLPEYLSIATFPDIATLFDGIQSYGVSRTDEHVLLYTRRRVIRLRIRS